MEKYSDLSINLTKKLSKSEKKNNGIFFTPPSTVKIILKLLVKYTSKITNILEPSCGSGEFLTELIKLDNVNITGIEYHKDIYHKVINDKKLATENLKIYNNDFLTFTSKKKYDLIIGNPPYYVMKKNQVNPNYYQYFDGRPNIFILFIIKSLSLLNSKGILAFVLPKSFLNSFYYNKLRKYINNNFRILKIELCQDKYLETQQETIIFIIKNTKPKKNINYTLLLENNLIFGSKMMIDKIKDIIKNSSTLNKLGFNTSVGKIIWNQHKDILTDNPNKTRLIYSSDIIDNKLSLKKYNNPDKKNYINKKGLKKLILVVNRGYGNCPYKFNYCLIDVKYEYLIENHLICIDHNTKIETSELRKKFEKIIESLEDKRTLEFIKLYFGNNAISTIELNNILPIFCQNQF